MGKNKRRRTNQSNQSAAVDGTNESENMSTVTDPMTRYSQTTAQTEINEQSQYGEESIQQDSQPILIQQEEESKEDSNGITYVGSLSNSSKENDGDGLKQAYTNEPEVVEANNATSPEYYDEATVGTERQNVIINNYPMKSTEQKLKVPFIERFNGNICVQKQRYEEAIAHYNKALLGMKMLFQMEADPVITTKEQAVKFIMDIEVTCCTNLAHCYIKMEQYHHAIKYTSQALEKDPQNKKALFRQGIAYTQVGELENAKEKLNRVVELEGDQDMKNAAIAALQDVKRREQKNKQNEKQMLKRMFKPQPGAASPAKSAAEDTIVSDETTKVDDIPLMSKDEALSQMEKKTEEVTEVAKTYPQLINEWIWWTIFLPITLPLNTTKFTVSKSIEWTLYTMMTLWSAFCVFSLIVAAIAVYVPVIGEKLAQICLIPSKIDSIPQQPFVRLAFDVLKLGARVATQQARQATTDIKGKEN